MTSSGGGVAAAFGFRYQYLVTVELLLDMYESGSRPDWRVDVDRIDQDSADILVYGPVQDPVRALQVKASMPASSTTMSMRTASSCLDALQAEHPGARELTLITNRTLTPDAVRYTARLNEHHEIAADEQLRIVDAREETLLALTARLVERVARIRVRGNGGIGQRLHHILVALLVDLVHDRGSQTARQGIDRDQVARILNESAAVLADAAGGRAWGRTFGVPDDRFLPRPCITTFLSERLRDDDLLSGTPPVAVLSGISGSGKSAAAAAWAASRRDHYAGRKPRRPDRGPLDRCHQTSGMGPRDLRRPGGPVARRAARRTEPRARGRRRKPVPRGQRLRKFFTLRRSRR